MLYLQPTFTLPTCSKKVKLTDLEYDLRVGNITQEEYDSRVKQSETLNT